MPLKIAVISASWNEKIVQSGEDNFIKAIKDSDQSDARIDVFKVPGSLEIPLAGKRALENGYDIAVGIGFVVNGGIYRHEFVGHTVVQSILDVQLQTNKPFLSVVLTPQAYCEHLDIYEDMYAKHMVNKGQEAARACLGMVDALEKIANA
jgi:6,7-dimethyl-8-ribityllumazine synthase